MIQCPFEHPYGYIYIYTNRFNGHRYIGKHKFFEPYIDLNYKGSGTVHWNYALNKYGWDGFTKEVLFWLEYNQEISEKEHNDILNQQEKYFIDLLGTFDNPTDYNETRGGDGISGDLMSGENNPMYGRSGELNPMYGTKGELSPWWGRKHTQEEKDKIAASLRGREVSQETRDKISRANRGHKASEKQKEAVRRANKLKTGANNPMWKGGKTLKNPQHSEFTKGKRMSPKTEFTSENSSGANNSQAKPVVQLTLDNKLVKKYGYISEVKKYGFDIEAVRRCCKGRQPKHKDYKWMYKSEYEEMTKEAQT